MGPHGRAHTDGAGQDAFQPGQLVRLKARPATTGVIVARLPSDPEARYQVFHDGSLTTYYASQIEPATLPEARPSVTPAALHAALTALQLRHPSTGHLYSLFASRINFVPYQFRPVLKLIQADRPRLLIADEVGVGKTIEAGLILKELQARRELRSVLVICPRPLVAERKWLEELKRFDEQFAHLDGPALRYCIEETHLDGVWPQQYARAILPYSLLDEALLLGTPAGAQAARGLLGAGPAARLRSGHRRRGPPHPQHRDLGLPDGPLLLRQRRGRGPAVRHPHPTGRQRPVHPAPPPAPGPVARAAGSSSRWPSPTRTSTPPSRSARGGRPGWQRDTPARPSQAALATPWGRNVLTRRPRPATRPRPA